MTTDITLGEMRELIEREEIKPTKLFEKEDFLNDKSLMKRFAEKEELEDYRAKEKDKKKEEEEEGSSPLSPGADEGADEPKESDDEDLSPD